MDEVLGIADEEIGPRTMWMCPESFDQFCRRQKIYPVTEYGLGVPYHAEDGALEGDSAGPTAYQACAAVRTNCAEFDGAVGYVVEGKGISLSELVFSDDRRVFHHSQAKWEQLAELSGGWQTFGSSKRLSWNTKKGTCIFESSRHGQEGPSPQ